MMKQTFVLFIALLFFGCTATQKVTRNIGSVWGRPVNKAGKFIDYCLANLNRAENNCLDIAPKPLVRPAINSELVKIKELSNYLNGIKSRLLEQWPVKVDHDICIYVTTNRTFTAYSTPWDIVLSMGVILDVSSEDELAFIIGHELSHILLQHHDVPNYFKKQEETVGLASKTAILAAKFEDMKVEKQGKKISVKQQNLSSTKRKMTDAYKIAMAINCMSNNVISSMLSRKNEEEADFLGTDLIVKAGYNASGYGAALDRIESSLVFTEAQLKAKKEKYQKIVTTLSSSEIPDGDELKMLAYLYANELSTKMLQGFAARYYNFDERIESIASYMGREYPEESLRVFKTDVLERSLKGGECGRIIKKYIFASNAMRALDEGDLKKAEALAVKSVSGSTGSHSYPRATFSLVRQAQGDLRKAAVNLNLIGSWEDSSLETVYRASRLNTQRKQYNKALTILDKSSKALGAESMVYPEMISVHVAAGNTQEVDTVLELCTAQNDFDIKKQCRIAAGKTESESENGIYGFFNKLQEHFTEE